MFKVYQKYLINNFLIKFLNLSLIFFSLTFILSILEEITFLKDIEVPFWYPYFLTILSAPITLFEIFPFIFLLTTQFLFYEMFKKKELVLLKANGLNNLKIVKILFFLAFVIGIFNIVIYYNFASKLNFQYSNIKNKFSDDNKYLAMVTQSGLWIKDEINEKTLLIKSELIKENILSKTIINEFNDDFELVRTIQSEKIDISQNKWVIFNPIITKNNVSEQADNPIYLETNFNEKRINNLFSNISTLDILKLFTLIEDYKKIGYSPDEILLHLLKLFTMPIFYGILTILSAIIMFNLSNDKPLIFHIALGILMSVIIYYMNFIFSSLASNGRIPIIASIFFPILILSFFTVIGLIDINEK
jgi:lipopolysaccharide export system permease protein